MPARVNIGRKKAVRNHRRRRFDPRRKSNRSGNPIIRKAISKAKATTRKVNAKNKQLYRPSFIPASCVIKSKTLTGYSNVSLFGTSGVGESGDPIEWHLIRPLNLTRVSNAAPSKTDRQSDSIWARNTKFELNIFPSKAYHQNFQVRVCYGYFKGDVGVGSQQLSAATMKTIYPGITDKLNDKDNSGKTDFYWKWEKTLYLSPNFIYDSDLEEGDHMGNDRTLIANWRTKRLFLNFNYNRKQTYANSDADSLNGYLPIIAIQCKPQPGNNQFTRPSVPAGGETGAYPSPRMSVMSTTYFSDIH